MISNINLFASGARKVFASHLFYLMVPILALLYGIGMAIAMPYPGTGFGIWCAFLGLTMIVFYIYFLCKQANGLREFSTAIADEGNFPSLMFKIAGITAIVLLVIFSLTVIFAIANAVILTGFTAKGLLLMQLLNQIAAILFFAFCLAGFIGLSSQRAFPNHNAAVLGVIAYSLYFMALVFAVIMYRNMGFVGYSGIAVVMAILVLICILASFILSAITWSKMSKTFQSNQNFIQNQNPYGNNVQA